MAGALTLYLLRHGEVHNPDKILYGRLPGYYLSTTGREQATAAGHYLKERPIVQMYSSPMERAQETAGIVAELHNNDLTVQQDERLNEVHSPFDGTPHSEMEKTWFDLYTGTQPPHEQPQDLRHRVLSFINEARARHRGQEIAVVSHGDIVVAMFLFAMQKPAHDIGRGKLDGFGLPEAYPSTASVSTLTFESDDPDEIPAYAYVRPY